MSKDEKITQTGSIAGRTIHAHLILTFHISGKSFDQNIIQRRPDSKCLSALFGIVWVAVSRPVAAHLVL